MKNLTANFAGIASPRGHHSSLATAQMPHKRAAEAREAAQAMRSRKNEGKDEKGGKTDKKKVMQAAAFLTIGFRGTLSEQLLTQKEALQTRLSAMQERLMTIAASKESIAYEEVITTVDGTEKRVKIFNSAEEYEAFTALEKEEGTVIGRIKRLNEELLAMDEKIRQAIVQERQQRIEAEQARMRERAAKKKEEEAQTDEEKEKTQQARQTEFFAKAGSVKSYIRETKVVKAKIAAEMTQRQNEMANDAMFGAAQEQAAAHNKFPMDISPVPDTSYISERGRIAEGYYTPDERTGAAQIEKFKSAIARLDDSINAQMGRINSELRVMNEENNKPSNKTQQSEDKKEEEEKGEVAIPFTEPMYS